MVPQLFRPFSNRCPGPEKMVKPGPEKMVTALFGHGAVRSRRCSVTALFGLSSLDFAVPFPQHPGKWHKVFGSQAGRSRRFVSAKRCVRAMVQFLSLPLHSSLSLEILWSSDRCAFRDCWITTLHLSTFPCNGKLPEIGGLKTFC